MTTHRLTQYHLCEEALKLPDLRQALYDEGAILMRDVLVNLHGERTRRVGEWRVIVSASLFSAIGDGSIARFNGTRAC